MTFTTAKEKEIQRQADLKDHWESKLNLGGPLFFATEGKETKKLTVKAQHVDTLREHYGEKKVRVMSQAILVTQKDLDAFVQEAMFRISKGSAIITTTLEGRTE